MTDRKTKILDAAQDLLVEVGSADLTMRKVAGRVGISLGNVQYHFPKRNDLLLALLVRFLEPYEAKLLTAETGQRNITTGGFEAMLVSAISEPEFTVCASIYKELWASSSHSPDISEALRAYYHRLAEFYRTVLSHASGLPVNDPCIARGVLVMLPMIEGYCVTKNALDIPAETLAAEWTKAIFAVIQSDTPTPAAPGTP